MWPAIACISISFQCVDSVG